MESLGAKALGFVPTMGAFHEGHLSLMREARKNHALVCVSLFVNPLQFGANEDFGRYPRNEDRDFSMAKEAGVDIMFAPSTEQIYPRKTTTIHVAGLSELWEGKTRPGHFDGVATVVAKLFNIVRPHSAYFGYKDLQQCFTIRRMVEDLNMPVQLHFIETVREPDGLAFSSRNVYLTADQRRAAPMLYKTLVSVAKSIEHREDAPGRLVKGGKSRLEDHGFDVDYLELVSTDDFQRTEVVTHSALIVAARLGTTRLIDNLRL